MFLSRTQNNIAMSESSASLKGSVLFMVVALMLVGCTSAASGVPSTSILSDPVTTTASQPLELQLPTGSMDAALQADADGGPVTIETVTNDGVLAAAVIILSDGDLEGAVLEGLITEAEAEAALQALEAGTLSQFAEQSP